MILVLTQSGMSIGKKSEMITMKVNGVEKSVAVRQIESVVVLRSVQITHDAMVLLSEHGIPVLYMPKTRPLCIVMPFAQHGFIATRRAQMDAYTNQRGLELVRSIEMAAATNKARLLKYYARNRRRTDATKAAEIMDKAKEIEKMIREMNKLGRNAQDPDKEDLRIDEKNAEENNDDDNSIMTDDGLDSEMDAKAPGRAESSLTYLDSHDLGENWDSKLVHESKNQTNQLQNRVPTEISEQSPELTPPNFPMNLPQSAESPSEDPSKKGPNENIQSDINSETPLDPMADGEEYYTTPNLDTEIKKTTENTEIPEINVAEQTIEAPKSTHKIENAETTDPNKKASEKSNKSHSERITPTQNPENAENAEKGEMILDLNPQFIESEDEDDFTGGESTSSLDRIRSPLATYRQAMMGLEGTAANLYFETLQMILDPRVGFHGRNRRPPKDPFNAALSFGYSLLQKEILMGLSAAGLEPFAGFLHTDRSGRPSLVFDLIEEFRQPVVDRFVIRMFQHKVLTDKDFENPTGEAGVLFKEQAMMRFIGDFYYYLRKEPQKLGNKTINFQQIIIHQARKIVRFLLEKDPKYEGFLFNW